MLEPRPEGIGRVQLARPGPWVGAGACVGQDPALWYPTQGGHGMEAKRICRGCPVRRACLAYALANGESDGIWGGIDLAHEPRVMDVRSVMEDPSLVDAGRPS